MADGDDRPGGPQPRRERPNPSNEAIYRAYTRLYDEEVDAEDLCDADELTGCGSSSISSCNICRE